MYLKSPTRGGATMFPQAKQPWDSPLEATQESRSVQEGSQSAQPVQGATQTAAVDTRHLLQHSSRQLSAGSDVYVPLQCTEAAAGLRVSPTPGSAILFW
jgi:hypothetical protein